MNDELVEDVEQSPPPSVPEAGFSDEGKKEVDSTLARLQAKAGEIVVLEQEREAPDELGQPQSLLSREEIGLLVNKVKILRETLVAATSASRAAEIFQDMVNGESGIDVQLRQLHTMLEFRSFSQEQLGQPTNVQDAEYRELLGEIDSELITLQEQLDKSGQVAGSEVEVDAPPTAAELKNQFAELKPDVDVAVSIVDALPPAEAHTTIGELGRASELVEDHLQQLQDLELALGAMYAKVQAGETSVLGEMQEAEFIQLWLEVCNTGDQLVVARDKARARADAEVKKIRESVPDDPDGVWQKSLASATDYFSNPKFQDGKARFDKLVKTMIVISGVGAEALGKMVEQSDLSTFIQFLIYGGNGRTGGGMGFEGRTGENTVPKEFFEDQLKRRPSEVGKAIALVHTQGLREAGWELSDDDKDKLEKGDPEVLRTTLVSLSKDYLNAPASNTEDRERRWNRFSHLIMKQTIFAETGKAGLDFTIKELIQLEGEKDPDKAWERQLGAAKPAEAAADAGAGEAVTAPPPEPAAVAG